jgi:hypothetical protein
MGSRERSSRGRDRPAASEPQDFGIVNPRSPVYQLNGEDHVLAWMRTRPSDEVEAMLDWLPKLADNPEDMARAHKIALPGVPAFTAMVPGTNAFVDYIVVEQYKTVMILGVTNFGVDDLPDVSN